jgi:diamine N-acetyltransferase
MTTRYVRQEGCEQYMDEGVRRAHPDDLDACFSVQRAADLAAFPHIFPPDDFPYPDQAVKERRRENLSSRVAVCWVCEDDGRIVGTAVLIGGLLDSIAVVPEKWGTGIAQALYATVLQHARAEGREKLELWVMEKNARARGFYAKRGWKPDGKTKELSFPPHPILLGYSLEPLNRAS